MDLGCIDMGCIEKQSDEAFLDSETSTNGSGLSNSKNRKVLLISFLYRNQFLEATTAVGFSFFFLSHCLVG